MAPSTPTSSNVNLSKTLPTQEEMVQEIVRLQAQIRDLHATKSKERFKIATPTTYDGTQGTLRGFLTQMRAYHFYHEGTLTNNADKVLCTAAFLKGDALNWFEPRMRDYLENPEEDQDDETKEIFQSYAKFEERLKGTFGDPDEERTAERQLMNLR